MKNLKELVDAIETDGKTSFGSWRKTPTGVTPARVWYDLSVTPGNPVPQYYASAPLISVNLKKSDTGLDHNTGLTSSKTFLKELTVISNTATALPMRILLLDYIMYYPFIDEGTTDEQILTTSTPLLRWTDGKGVQIMAVSVAGRTGGQTFTVKYTNQDGVANRVTGTASQNSTSITGNIVTTEGATVGMVGPFLPLQEGDSGVISIQSVTMGGVDVGLFTLVLVKVIASTQILEITAPVEKDFLLNNALALPEIEPDSYLNFICLPNGSMAATSLYGTIKTIWT